MAGLNFNFDFFFPKEDGNLSLATIQQRIEEALKCIHSADDYIQLDNGTKCYSKEDLEKALFSAQSTKQEKNKTKNNETTKIFKTFLSIAAVSFFALFVLGLCNVGMDILRLIASFFGIMVPLFLLRTKLPSKEWLSILRIIIISSLILFLNSVFLCFGIPDGILDLRRILSIIANILLIVGFVKISKIQDRFIYSIPFLLLLIPCLVYIVYFTSVLIASDDFIYENGYYWIALSTILNYMYAIKFGLASICIFIILCNPEVIKSINQNGFGSKMLLPVLIAFLLTVGWYVVEYNSTLDYFEYRLSRPHYKGIRSALQDGSISYGMSYPEIENICGPADNLSRKNGVVEFAYYGNVQLCFDHGHFDHWND